LPPASAARFMTISSWLSHPLLRHSLVGATALAAAGLTGCAEKKPPPGRGRGGGGPAPVIVGQVQRKTVPLVIEAIGSVEPIKSAAIRSQITGSLMKIGIQEGQDVKLGDLLFEIDPRPFQNTLASAQADQKKIGVQLETARAQVARYRELSANAMVSKEQFQQIQDNERALTAQSLTADAAVANAALQLSYCSIRAPLTGRTGNLNVHEGDLVRANDVGTMVTINQLNPIYVTFGVPQQQLARLQRYRAAGTLKVTVAQPGGSNTPEIGELTFMDNTVDAATGTLKLKATFANKGHLLWPGQFTTVSVTLAEPEVLVVAGSALQNSQAGQHVFVVKENRHGGETALFAELRPVVVERIYAGDVVIAQGLTEGETVVIDGQLRVIPGRPVLVKQPDAPAGERSGGDRPKGKGKGKKKEA
jgi:multidrug efflux system membrane fusion protein